MLIPQYWTICCVEEVGSGGWIFKDLAAVLVIELVSIRKIKSICRVVKSFYGGCFKKGNKEFSRARGYGADAAKNLGIINI